MTLTTNDYQVHIPDELAKTYKEITGNAISQDFIEYYLRDSYNADNIKDIYQEHSSEEINHTLAKCIYEDSVEICSDIIDVSKYAHLKP